MARNLKLLTPPPVVAGEPGLSPLDERLGTITSLAEQQKYREAADLTEELLLEQIYDIRPISIYLYEAFFEEGLKLLPQIFTLFRELHGAAAVGPAKRHDEYFSRRVGWFFTTLYNALGYHGALAGGGAQPKGRREPTADWERLLRGATPALLDEAIAAGQTLIEQIGVDLDKDREKQKEREQSKQPRSVSSGDPPYGATLDLLRMVRDQLQAAAAPPPSVAAPSARAQAAPAPARPQAPASVLAPDDAPPGDPLEPVRRRIELVVSHPFLDLMRKLKAFEDLIEKKQFEKAALVADDIQNTLDHFDPRAHFPELFGRFSAQLSKNIKTLEGHWHNRDSEAWRALSQFYRVDLKGFVDGGLWNATPRRSSSRSRPRSSSAPAASS